MCMCLGVCASVDMDRKCPPIRWAHAPPIFCVSFNQKKWDTRNAVRSFVNVSFVEIKPAYKHFPNKSTTENGEHLPLFVCHLKIGRIVEKPKQDVTLRCYTCSHSLHSQDSIGSNDEGLHECQFVHTQLAHRKFEKHPPLQMTTMNANICFTSSVSHLYEHSDIIVRCSAEVPTRCCCSFVRSFAHSIHISTAWLAG